MRVLVCAIFLVWGSWANAQETFLPEPTLVFEGNKLVSDEELLEVANKCLGKRTRSPDKSKSDVEYCLSRVKLFLYSKGYLGAVVGSPHWDSTVVPSQFVVPIEEGALYRIGEIRIRGSQILSSEQILGMFNLRSGDIVDGEALGVWLFERVQKFYANLGYIQYTVEAEPEFHSIPGSSEGVVNLLVTIEEGKPFTVRSISFEGNGNIPIGILQSEMLVRDGDVFNQELFEESIRRLNRLVVFERIDLGRDVHYGSNDETPELDLTIKLKKRP